MPLNHLEGGGREGARGPPSWKTFLLFCLFLPLPNPSVTQRVKIVKTTVQVESRLGGRGRISSIRRLKIHSSKNYTSGSGVTKMGNKSKKEGLFGNFPGGAGTKTGLPGQGARVWSLVREIDPTCRN